MNLKLWKQLSPYLKGSSETRSWFGRWKNPCESTFCTTKPRIGWALMSASSCSPSVKKWRWNRLESPPASSPSPDTFSARFATLSSALRTLDFGKTNLVQFDLFFYCRHLDWPSHTPSSFSRCPTRRCFGSNNICTCGNIKPTHYLFLSRSRHSQQRMWLLWLLLLIWLHGHALLPLCTGRSLRLCAVSFHLRIAQLSECKTIDLTKSA